MARTRVWPTEEANYTDNTLVTSIDNKGTELRQDTREVINQLIGNAIGDVLADPPVITTLSGATLTASTNLNVAKLTMTGTSAKIIASAASLVIRNAADSATNVSITDAGAMAVPLSIATSTFICNANSTKFILGTTNLLFRDSTDASTFLTITPTAITVASTLSFAAGTFTVGTHSGVVTVLATSATAGFLVMPTFAGAPTGNPSQPGSHGYDTTNSKFWVCHSGATWKGVVLA